MSDQGQQRAGKPSLQGLSVSKSKSNSRSCPSLMCAMDLDSEVRNGYESPSLMTETCRSVSFQPLSTLSLYDAQEPEGDFRLWYTEEEEELSRANARLELSVFKQIQMGGLPEGCSLNLENLSTVGLEKYLLSPGFGLSPSRSRRLVTSAVLIEQAQGSEDKAERIAFAATQLSEGSVELAKVVGRIQHRASRVPI